MRVRMSLIGALLLLSPGLAGAQQETQKPPVATPPVATAPSDVVQGTPWLGKVDFGLRGDSIAGDEARFNRFRDVRDGAFLDRFRLSRETDNWVFLGEARNVGYRDQRFLGEFESIGRLKGRFEWDQIPLFISRDTRSLQRDLGNGVLGVDDGVQQRIQAGTLTLANAVKDATAFDMRSRRHVAAMDLTYTATDDVDFKINVKNTERAGSHLQSFSVGSSPGNGIAQELGVPMDQRTTDMKAFVEYANARGLVSAGVNASWFVNNIPTVRFDNPLRFTDISGGPSQGVAATWPSNTLVSFMVNGSYKLAARTSAVAAISIGRANQDEPFVSPTSNTALVAPPLTRASADASANIVSMVYSLNSRPIENVWLNARYRYYDYANRTPHYETVALVGDWQLGTAHWEAEPLSVKRQTIDLDASFTPVTYLAVGVGYGREDADRTFRIFENTAEDIFRVSVDSTGNAYFTMRVKYEVSNREGSGFEAHLLEDVGEQPDTRHFDVANRERNRVTGILTLTPTSWLNLNGSIGTGHDDYKGTGFGLRDSRTRSYGMGFDVMPHETVNFGVSYERDKYTANQYSRTANPAPNTQFDDPRRDWWIDSNDLVHTVTASVDLLKAIPRTDIRLGYDLSDGKASYVYGLRPDQTVFTTVALAQLAPLRNRLTGGRAEVQYFLRSNIGLGVAYWYEDYDVEDFALNPTTINTLNIGTATLYSGYLYRPYTAHTTSLRLTYLW